MYFRTIRRLFKKYTRRHWTIGFVQNTIQEIVEGKPLRVEWMEYQYKDRWFADPFILDVDDIYIYVLAEEFYMPMGRAYIAKLTIDRSTKKLIETKPILKLDTHLSYPAILRRNNNVYIYPESGKSGRLVLYRYDTVQDTVTEEKELLHEDVGDATYTDLFGEELLFCTTPPLYNDEILHIYRKNAEGYYVASEQIEFKDKIARMAGDFFSLNGIIYRPAQDSNMSYGNGLVIQEVSHHNGKWNFKDIHRYYSPNKKYPLGIHTLNHYKDVIVVDAVGYWHPILASVLVGLKHICMK